MRPRTVAQLKHPNIVGIHEIGREGDTVFIVSDLVQGVTLADWLSARKMPFRKAAKAMRESGSDSATCSSRQGLFIVM